MEAGTAAPPTGGDELAEKRGQQGAPDPETQPEEGKLEGEGAGEQQPESEIILEGDGQLSLRVSGKKPDKATVKIRGGSIHVGKGQFDKGDTVDLLIKAQCAEVHLVDKRDGQTGEIIETERRQIFKISAVERV